MKKSERIDLRLTPEERKLLETKARERNMNNSQCICSLLKQNAIPKSHEQQITDSLTGNDILHSLLLNPTLSNTAKQTIGKEIQKYV